MWTSTSGPITQRRAYLFGFGNGNKGVFPTEMEDGRAGVPFSPYEERFAVVGVSLNPARTAAPAAGGGQKVPFVGNNDRYRGGSA